MRWHLLDAPRGTSDGVEGLWTHPNLPDHPMWRTLSCPALSCSKPLFPARGAWLVQDVVFVEPRLLRRYRRGMSSEEEPWSLSRTYCSCESVRFSYRWCGRVLTQPNHQFPPGLMMLMDPVLCLRILARWRIWWGRKCRLGFVAWSGGSFRRSLAQRLHARPLPCQSPRGPGSKRLQTPPTWCRSVIQGWCTSSPTWRAFLWDSEDHEPGSPRQGWQLETSSRVEQISEHLHSFRGSRTQKTTLRSQSCPGAGAFLSTTPSNLLTMIDSFASRTPLSQTSPSHSSVNAHQPCVCTIDPLGHHRAA